MQQQMQQQIQAGRSSKFRQAAANSITAFIQSNKKCDSNLLLFSISLPKQKFDGQLSSAISKTAKGKLYAFF